MADTKVWRKRGETNDGVDIWAPVTFERVRKGDIVLVKHSGSDMTGPWRVSVGSTKVAEPKGNWKFVGVPYRV